LRTMWEKQPTLHRAKTTEIVASGITIADGVTRHEFHWESFIGWSETKTLFVFFPSEFQVIFFPKKAFASEEELNALRALAGQIPNPDNPAFEVVSAKLDSMAQLAGRATPPPLPDDQKAENTSISPSR
jgi:hypothetical protein